MIYNGPPPSGSQRRHSSPLTAASPSSSPRSS